MALLRRGAELESLPDSADADRALPNLQVARYDRFAAWEEPRGESVTLRVTACPRVDDFETPELAYEFGKQHALDLARAAAQGDPSVEDPPVETDEATFESDCTRESFADRVQTVKQYIRDGDTFQANVSQRLRAPAAVHPVEAFDALRTVNPAPYSALLEFPGVDLVSAARNSSCTATATVSRPNPSLAPARGARRPTLTTDWKRTCSTTGRSGPNTRCSSIWSATTWGK